MWGQIPRVEALHASTLGYEIATPTELPGVRTIHNGLLVSLPMELRHLRIVFRHALIVLGGS